MRCSVCHQDYKQSDIVDNYFVKDTTEATSTSDEKTAQVSPTSWFNGDYALYKCASTSVLVGSPLMSDGGSLVITLAFWY